MVMLMEGPLGVLVQVRPLQTKGCDAYVDREECFAATSQQVKESEKGQERGGDEHLPHLHLRMAIPATSTS